MFNELLRAAPLQEGLFSLWHWTGKHGREIDIIAKSRQRLVAIDVKASSSVSREDLRHLQWFSSSGPAGRRQVTSIVFYLGEQPVKLEDRCFALPVSMFWAERV